MQTAFVHLWEKRNGINLLEITVHKKVMKAEALLFMKHVVTDSEIMGVVVELCCVVKASFRASRLPRMVYPESNLSNSLFSAS